MRNLKRFGAVAIACVLALAIAAPAAADDITVGQFIQQLARAKNLNATDARIAADALAATGVILPSGLDYSEVLTEGSVAAIARAAGLNVRTATPTASFDSAKAQRFFSSFSRELGDDAPRYRTRGERKFHNNSSGGQGEDEQEGPTGTGKGKGKGKNGRTPSEPD